MEAVPSRIIRQIIIIVVLGIVGSLIFYELLPYFSGFLGAITLYILLKKPMKTLKDKGWKTFLAASLLMFLSFIGILFPILGITLMLSNKLDNAVSNAEKLFAALQKHIIEFENTFVTITEDNNPKTSLKYFYSDPSVVTTPTKMITMPSNEVTFTLRTFH
jgi:predicted PurR-regulated permease PerM